MGDKNNQWHPGFVAAMQMELADNREDLEFTEEHNLSSKPLQIDLLVIKNNKNTVISNAIGKLFQRYNIIEYKSPDDEMGIDVFYKVNAYACLYKSSADKENLYSVEDITITLLRHNYPRTLMGHLRAEGYTITEKEPGIYEISGKTMFATQIIVSRELKEEEHIWLNALRRNISKETYKKLLLMIHALKGREREIYGEAVLEVVSHANNIRIEKWKEEAEMCATLERIMAPEIEEWKRRAREEGIEEGREEGIEKGREEGREEGIEEGIEKGIKKGRILAYAELGVSIEDIAKQFSLSIAEIEKILSEE